jgi:pimeloyl-ACP methyl ester carboxylesterase
MLPQLQAANRVIRVDLLGHGGSEKAKAGYSIEDQAGTVASALAELGVGKATVVGHSLGFTVATALAERSPELVSGLVDIDQATNEDLYDEPFLAKLIYVPLIGQALARVVPDFAIRDSYKELFAPGYNMSSGFENPDQPVDDFNAMTYTSFKKSSQAEESYVDDRPLNERLAQLKIPLLVIFGSEEQIYTPPDEAANAYKSVPGAVIEMVEGAGHSPNVEKPKQTAGLVLEFAANPAAPGTAIPGQNEFQNKPPNKHKAKEKKAAP